MSQVTEKKKKKTAVGSNYRMGHFFFYANIQCCGNIEVHSYTVNFHFLNFSYIKSKKKNSGESKSEVVHRFYKCMTKKIKEDLICGLRKHPNTMMKLDLFRKVNDDTPIHRCTVMKLDDITAKYLYEIIKDHINVKDIRLSCNRFNFCFYEKISEK